MENNCITSNVPVLMVFFNRSKPLEKVFEAVREAKPKILFLAQDGAREGNIKDKEGISACREVVKNIDWECDVYTDFSDVNLGCGRRVSSAITWAFEKVDRLIILEDDCVPDISFFPFADEVLEKHKDDDRICLISAMNNLEKYDNANKDSYFYCNTGSIWGWATWKRVWKDYDFNMSFISQKDLFKKIRKSKYPRYYKRFLIKQGKDCYKTLNSGKKLSYWTYQFGMLRFLNNQVNIVPNVNMITNVGIDSESTHAVANIKMMPKGIRKVFYMKKYSMEFPLRHPKEFAVELNFDKALWRLLGMPFFVRIHRKLSSIIRRIFFGGPKEIKKMFKKVFKRK